MDSLRLALRGVAKELSKKVPDGSTLGPVSYTQQTLPTICIV